MARFKQIKVLAQKLESSKPKEQVKKTKRKEK